MFYFSPKSGNLAALTDALPLQILLPNLSIDHDLLVLHQDGGLLSGGDSAIFSEFSHCTSAGTLIPAQGTVAFTARLPDLLSEVIPDVPYERSEIMLRCNRILRTSIAPTPNHSTRVRVREAAAKPPRNQTRLAHWRSGGRVDSQNLGHLLQPLP